MKQDRIRIRKDGVLEWLSPPQVPFKIEKQTRTRFSEITPTNPFLFIAFRLIRLCFGEGKWWLPEWTRRWPCEWKATILLGEHRGRSMVGRSRKALLDWECYIWCKPRIDL